MLFQWMEIAASRMPELRSAFAIPNGGKRAISVARRLKREGVKAGVPDICLPVARHGMHALYIELKVGRNKVSAAQQEWVERLSQHGNYVHVCYGWETARAVIEDYLKPAQEHDR